MRLTAVDIHAREFSKGAWGYSVKEVEDFRQEVADNFEEVQLELAATRQALEQAARELEHYRALEKSMNDSLILAQRSADEVRANSHKEAELILRSADSEAREIIARARADRAAVEREIRELEAARDRFADEVAGMVASLEERIEAIRSRRPRFAGPPMENASVSQGPNGTSGASSSSSIPGWLKLGPTRAISGS